jgi:hypothetical protein
MAFREAPGAPPNPATRLKIGDFRTALVAKFGGGY